MSEATSTIEEPTTDEWVPQPCDPDAESVQPEGVSDSAWALISDRAKHTISQHVAPKDRKRAAEVEAYFVAAQAHGVDQEDAPKTLVVEQTFLLSDEDAHEALNKASEILLLQAMSPEQRLLQAIFGDNVPDFGGFEVEDDEETEG